MAGRECVLVGLPASGIQSFATPNYFSSLQTNRIEYVNQMEDKAMAYLQVSTSVVSLSSGTTLSGSVSPQKMAEKKKYETKYGEASS
jgi:hypothetical protein